MTAVPPAAGDAAQVFQAMQDRYHDLLSQGAAAHPDTITLAASLLRQLPAHVARGEVSKGEAVLLQQSLFDTLESDAGVRVQQRLALRDASAAASAPVAGGSR